jgi:hypothetical protein
MNEEAKAHLGAVAPKTTGYQYMKLKGKALPLLA